MKEVRVVSAKEEMCGAARKNLKTRNLQNKPRTKSINTINDVSRKISALTDLDELLPYIVKLLQSTYQYYYIVSIFLIDPTSGNLNVSAIASSEKEPKQTALPLKVTKGIGYTAACTGESIVANDVGKEPRYLFVDHMAHTNSEMAVPIKLGTKTLGALDVQSKKLGAFDNSDLFLLETLAAQVAVAIENARLYENVREAAVLEERSRLARDIHDSLAQVLTSVVLHVDTAERALNTDIDKARSHLNSASKLARQGLNEAQRSLWSLRPKTLEQLPLDKAIAKETEEFTQSTDTKVQYKILGRKRALDRHIDTALLRICQEALNNVRRHAQASKVKVILSYHAQTVDLRIEDNGIGFDLQTPTSGTFGLISIRERVDLLSGTSEIGSQPNQGTILRVTIPTGTG